MRPLYFWDGTSVICRDREDSVVTILEGLEGMPCVDTYENIPQWRYGIFYRNGGWTYVPIEEFPKEFKMHLLLLGVSI